MYLTEGSPPDLRESVLDQTLRLARRRRHWRGTRRATTLAIVAGFIALLSWRLVSNRHLASDTTCRIVHTRPLPAGAITTTRRFQNVRRNAAATRSSIVHTDSEHHIFRTINDDELLALVAPGTAVLVGVGHDAEELVFVDPDDSGFPVN